MAFSLKAKKMVEMKNPEKVILKNGKPAYRGTCPESGAILFKVMPPDKK